MNRGEELSAAADSVHGIGAAADIETSSEGYAARFSGAVGEWMLRVQEAAVLEALRPIASGGSILDVGGGHGQLVPALVRAGYRVTVVGSNAECAKRVRHFVQSGSVDFVSADLLSLPFAEQAFDGVVSVRLLSHTPQWRAQILELCRVTRSQVVVDYPTNRSVNAIAPMFFTLKRRVEHNTRNYPIFDEREVINTFAEKQLTVRYRSGQFFFPMALHRALRSPTLSRAAEAIIGAVPGVDMLRSPVIAGFAKNP